MKTVFCTSYSNNNLGIYNLSLKNHEDYCKSFGYDLVNYKESYSPYININRIQKFFKSGYETVILIGTDVIIKRQVPITEYMPESKGVIMCRQVAGKYCFNGDFIIFINNEFTNRFLYVLSQIQQSFNSTQSCIAKLQTFVTNSFYLQLAAPICNQHLDYSMVKLDKYFSFHYHTIGKSPSVKEKAQFMKHDLGVLQ